MAGACAGHRHLRFRGRGPPPLQLRHRTRLRRASRARGRLSLAGAPPRVHARAGGELRARDGGAGARRAAPAPGEHAGPLLRKGHRQLGPPRAARRRAGPGDGGALRRWDPPADLAGGSNPARDGGSLRSRDPVRRHDLPDPRPPDAPTAPPLSSGRARLACSGEGHFAAHPGRSDGATAALDYAAGRLCSDTLVDRRPPLWPRGGGLMRQSPTGPKVLVPTAWNAMLALSFAFVCALCFLLTNAWKWDSRLEAAMEMGVVLSLLLCIQGSIWAKPTWGVWWDWDPRLTTTAVMVFAFGGILALRAFVDDPARRAVWSAVACIVAFVDVPIVYFSVKWWNSLHQAQSTPQTVSKAFHWPLRINAVGILFLWTGLLALRARGLSDHRRRVRRLRSLRLPPLEERKSSRRE